MNAAASQDTPLVGIIMGSQSDWATLEHTANMLKQLGVPFEAEVVSAHRTPDRLFEYAEQARDRGIQVIIAGAGGAAHLPGMCAAKTDLPVLGVEVYDDFAHHPTAIDTTLEGARKRLGERKLWAIIEPRSNTMRMGSHKDGLAHSARLADEVIWYQPEGLDWDLQPVIAAAPNKAVVARTLDDIIHTIVSEAGEGDAVVIMSNGGFGGLHQKLISALNAE